MQTKLKLLFIVTLMLLGLAIATIINVSLNFRDYSIKSALEKAEMAARTVEDGLTAHMVNGIMDKREYFLEQISQNDNIKSLWLVRSEHVIKQYGEGFNSETARDAIDKEVLRTGKVVKKIDESTNRINLRVTMPYKAVTTGSANCLKCHDVKRDDTLGAISMEFDISDMRSAGFFTILKILGINLIFIIVVLLLINYYVTPYMKLFEDLQEGIQKAYSGDFTHNFNTKIKGEAGKAVEQLNTLFIKMQEAFGEIRVNLATFVTERAASCNDPLFEAKQVINELSDIYKFKKTIELDENKNIIYKRIIEILKNKFNIDRFAFYEIDIKHSKRKLIYATHDDLKDVCNTKHIDADSQKCRACRTNSNVISTDFTDLCYSCCSDNIHYLCHPFQINDEASLLISMTSHDSHDIAKLTSYLPSISNYLEAAKPVIESNILMDKLHDTSLRDGMTNLYNRRFLENFIDKIMSQIQRAEETYHVMMLDVDFFKMVNDTYGHDIGDKVIVDLANVLKNNIREADLAIRYGGEEFLIMLHNSTDEGALRVANNIHQEFGKLRFDVGNGESLQKTISIGISKFPKDGDSIWKCIKYADTALYKAKNTGRNKIVEFEDHMFDKDQY
ncbi:MAG: GGDEF domain-containing protein [Thiovulaceae bacterium]|nr:GGDEF domain-containing protein [Sulfurimonadaceae bacterium]